MPRFTIFRAALAAMSGLGVSAAPLFAQTSAGSVRLPAAPGRLIDIGGQRLHLNCTGRGSPTVVFENGAGDFSIVWSLVQPGVAELTRACSYDRAGYAWSDPGARPRTYDQIALELRATLERAGEHGPSPASCSSTRCTRTSGSTWEGKYNASAISRPAALGRSHA